MTDVWGPPVFTVPSAVRTSTAAVCQPHPNRTARCSAVAARTTILLCAFQDHPDRLQDRPLWTNLLIRAMPDPLEEWRCGMVGRRNGTLLSAGTGGCLAVAPAAHVARRESGRFSALL